MVLRGKLLRQTGDEKFVFSDGSGEIRVEIDDDLFRKLGSKVSEHTVVEIRGEVDKDPLRKPEIDVERIVTVTP